MTLVKSSNQPTNPYEIQSGVEILISISSDTFSNRFPPFTSLQGNSGCSHKSNVLFAKFVEPLCVAHALLSPLLSAIFQKIPEKLKKSSQTDLLYPSLSQFTSPVSYIFSAYQLGGKCVNIDEQQNRRVFAFSLLPRCSSICAF